MFDAPVKLSDVPELVISKNRIVSMLKNLEFFSLVRKYNAELDKLDPGAKDAEHDETMARAKSLLLDVKEKQKVEILNHDPDPIVVEEAKVISERIKVIENAISH